MLYPILPQKIPFDRRTEINEKVLYSIDSGKNLLPHEAIYNCYTGIGGLHELKQEDFPNFHEYTKAKKEIEMGQFFTPHDICKEMVEIASPETSDMILDMCCGMGNFFNHLPNQFNAYGFDIELNSVKVARYLYPKANIEKADIRMYDPEQRFDIVIGNPPFNLDFNGELSQYYYCKKAYEILNPAGLLLIIVPCSFLQSDFWNKTQVNNINDRFSFLGQVKLDPNAFASVGVHNFETKILAFVRQSSNLEMKEYSAETFVSMEELKVSVAEVKEVRKAQRLKLFQESESLQRGEEKIFDYKINKYLYELKTHKHLRDHYDKAIALVTKFRNQKPPKDCSLEEREKWEKSKLTHAKVLATIYRYIKRQNIVPRKEIALVKTNYGFKLKAYAPRLLDGLEKRYVTMYDLIAHNHSLPYPYDVTPKQDKQYKIAHNYLKKRQKEYLVQNRPYDEMSRDQVLDAYVNELTFISPKDNQVCHFNKLQKEDIGLIFQKRYPLLNWQQGSGKTAVAYHFGKMLLNQNKVKYVVVLAPAIATDITWKNFLSCNKEAFTKVTKSEHLDNLQPKSFIVVSITMLEKLKVALKRLMKINSNKICLLFDESDEITNSSSKRTKNSLSIFRRAKYKMLATGTTTRNNINELYSQLELLYNNSVNMISYSSECWYENKEKEIVSKSNPYYFRPFPPRGGARLFKECFSPGKTSVFGIEKQNQDVYNKEDLFNLINKTILTRKFKDFADGRYSIQTHTISPSAGEREVYRTIVEEFALIYNQYFNSTGDGRKDAALRLIRQITLLIRACSTPNYMSGYYGDRYPQKLIYIGEQVRDIPGKVAIGCTSLDTLNMYEDYFRDIFPERPLFVIQGSVPFKSRQKIINQYEATENGILVCTQQSLKSSVNIPTCNDVFLEALLWNIPKMEQFYFRFIRLDSEEHTRVHFVTYEDSIEQNLMALILTKERLNDFIKTGEVKQQSEIFEEFDISPSIIDGLLTRSQDDKGRFQIQWGMQKVC